jgi:tetratricopeptide (TPR) repeat protein
LKEIMLLNLARLIRKRISPWEEEALRTLVIKKLKRMVRRNPKHTLTPDEGSRHEGWVGEEPAPRSKLRGLINSFLNKVGYELNQVHPNNEIKRIMGLDIHFAELLGGPTQSNSGYLDSTDIFKTLNRYDVVARFTEMRKEDPYQDGAYGGLNAEKFFARVEKQKLSFEQNIGIQYFMQAITAMKLLRIKETMDSYLAESKLNKENIAYYSLLIPKHKNKPYSPEICALYYFFMSLCNTPYNPISWYNTGYLLNGLGKNELSIDCFKLAARMNIEYSGHACFNIARILEKNGNQDAGKYYLKAAQEVKQLLGEHRNEVINALRKYGYIKEALKLSEHSLDFSHYFDPGLTIVPYDFFTFIHWHSESEIKSRENKDAMFSNESNLDQSIESLMEKIKEHVSLNDDAG